ncbi:unnamed protein product [Linum trigynum]|uniref:Uncharacterized protein n=1 Tax=Linum trigynum TaxID=586398 RepID=A0AAV2CIT1_9ROSI
MNATVGCCRIERPRRRILLLGLLSNRDAPEGGHARRRPRRKELQRGTSRRPRLVAVGVWAAKWRRVGGMCRDLELG